MRFKTTGTFETEKLIDIMQRIMAQLQDVGVPHVSGVNIYLQTIDDTGTERGLAINGQYVEELDVCCEDLVIEQEPEENEIDWIDQNACGPSHHNHRYKRFAGAR